MNPQYDAVVVGAGPNGLAAAITLAQARLSVLLVEANPEIGGACRSAALTLPGFVHDTCSAIHPMAVASPFFRWLPLEKYGLKWIQPEFPLAHPLDGDGGVLLHRPLAEQVKELGHDGNAYKALMETFVSDCPGLMEEVLQPLLHLPKKPLLLAKFGWQGLRSASDLIRGHFKTEAARAIFAGMAAHSFLSLHSAASAAIGLVLATVAHANGWPMPEGGAGLITKALGACFESLGGRIITGQRVENIDALPASRAIFFDLTPRQVLAIAGRRFPPRYLRALTEYRYGPGVFKMDYALSAPIPWKFPNCARAGTVHLGGTWSEIEQSEQSIFNGEPPRRPFVLVTQPTLFDPTRAPKGKHIAWAYCHIPNACEVDMTGRIEDQIERYAPGFRDCVIARCARGPALLEKDNGNLIGGDINGGLANLGQLMARPVLSPQPYRTPVKGVYLCSASTPPGGGVHGMSGRNAAVVALRDIFK